ncbi:MAG: glycosyltransferase, partial [Acidaminococcaceae bacterium]|nr:glycosyltransferase [Acidaminococcaceae bacterium]
EQVQLVVVGTGDEEYANALRELAWTHPGSVSVNILFDEGLARRVYAGADMFIMPSRYEACGLSQMIAMRYGTIPVVRETGGLKDSVRDFDKYYALDGNGLSFENFNAHELLFTIKRGLTYFADKPLWEKMVLNAMKSDNSWNKSARAYADLYDKVAGVGEEAEPEGEQTESVAEKPIETVAEEKLPAVKEEGDTAAEIEAKDDGEKEIAEAAAVEAEPQIVNTVEKQDEDIEAEPVAEAEEGKTVKKKAAVKKTSSAKKATTKKTGETKAAAKKTATKKTTVKKTAADEDGSAEPKKKTVRKTAAKKKAADADAAPVETAEPKKRGRKPGSKNKKKDAE